MEMQKEEAKMLQWHPAFFAEIQIELQEDAEHLIFENEHQLGTKPKEIDVLIIKKDKGRVIRKNIGRIFRQHNIVEYKSPLDYLSIDDFYKVYGYTCFYKSDTSQMDSIPIEELTITLVTGKYPRKLIHHLKTKLRYQVKKAESGIYYVTGDKIPIQIIVTKELTEAENLWLKSLTNELEQNETAEKLLEEFKRVLGIEVGETTPDGKFSLDCLRCVGACGLAPVVIIGEKVYGRLQSVDVKKIIEDLE